MDFAGWIDTWRRVLTQPGEPVFEQEKMNPNGTLQTALIWMVIAGVVAAIFGTISAAMSRSTMETMIAQMGLPPEAQQAMRPMMEAAMGTAGYGAIIWVPVGFLIGTFIMHLIARVLGGQGDFGTFAYLSSTFRAPLTIASSILGVIPFLGGCVVLLLGIYSFIESFFAIKVNYNLSSGRAVAAILIPLVLLFLLVLCAFAIAVAIAGSMGS